MKLKPTQNNILCSLHDLQESSKIHLPEGTMFSPYAVVLDIGDQCKFLKPGDKVLFHPSNVTYAEDVDDEKLVIIPEPAVFAVYVDPPIPITS